MFSELCPHPATHKSSQHDSACVTPNPPVLNKEQIHVNTHTYRGKTKNSLLLYQITLFQNTCLKIKINTELLCVKRHIGHRHINVATHNFKILACTNEAKIILKLWPKTFIIKFDTIFSKEEQCLKF